jgi:hypothetical protein
MRNDDLFNVFVHLYFSIGTGRPVDSSVQSNCKMRAKQKIVDHTSSPGTLTQREELVQLGAYKVY